MSRKQQPESIQDIIRRIKLGEPNATSKILDKWNNLIGNSYAKHCAPAVLRKGILIINVENSAWMYMLRLKKPQTLEKLKKLDGAIQDIRFRIGKVNEATT